MCGSQELGLAICELVRKAMPAVAGKSSSECLGCLVVLFSHSRIVIVTVFKLISQS